jgi:hypothetical protein
MKRTKDSRNLHTALILGSIAFAVFVGFIARYWYLQQ